MNTWFFYWIRYLLKHGQPFERTAGWSIKLEAYIMSYFIKKDGLYLATQVQITEDDYWEVTDTDASIGITSQWVKDPSDAKAFYDADDASRYIMYHRYKGCEVVKVKF